MVDMRQNIIPLLEQYGVDLVLSGHSHIYERSKFIKGHYGLETTFNNSIYPTGNVVQNSVNSYTKSSLRGSGTIYVVCGVSGKTGGTTQTGYPHNAMQVSTTSKSGSLVLNINGGVLNCKFLTSTGTIADDFTITKTVQPTLLKNQNMVEEMSDLNIYPNPSDGLFRINYNSKSEAKGLINVFNTNFQLVYSKEIFIAEESNNFEIDLSDKQKGMYYLVLNTTDNITKSYKIIIE